MANNRPTDRASNYIITNNNIYRKMKLILGLFSTKSCFALTYGNKFNSINVFRIKGSFWAFFTYILINIPTRKSRNFRNFRHFLGFLGVAK
jgi:hypothetical protein